MKKFLPILFFIYILFIIFLQYKLIDKYPEFLWIFIPIWVFLIFYKEKSSDVFISNANKIRKQIDKFVIDEICSSNEALLKKYKNSYRDMGYDFPPLSFVKLIKGIEQRNKYCELTISMINERIKFHNAFIREWNLDPKKSVSKIHTVIAISLIIGAIGAEVFGLTWGIIFGAVSYWIINEYPSYQENRDQDNKFKNKRSNVDQLNEINSITNEWLEIRSQYEKLYQK